MSKFRLIFYRNREEDKEFIWNFFQEADPAGWIDRAIYSRLPLYIVKDIVEKNNGAKEQLFEYLDKEYDIFEKQNLYSEAENYNVKLWDRISCEFSKRVFEITSRDLDEYRCLISMCLTTSAWNETTRISKNIKLLWEEQFLPAFEILLSHTFKCVRDYYSEEEIASAWDVWGFAEITAGFIIRDKVIYKMFPDVYKEDLDLNWFDNTPYTCLIKYEDVFKKFWKERKSFRDYIDRSVEYLKENHIEF